MSKKETYLKGAVLLGAAGILVKIMGALFRIPLGRAMGSEGMGYYQVAYTVYNFLLAFTYAGFPTAISKLVSEKKAKGQHGHAHAIFSTTLQLLTFLGLAGSLFLALGARYLVDEVFKSPLSYHAVMALVPTIFFISVLAAYRGYFQGMKDMKPTALSQIAEQLGRVVVGLSLAFLLLRTMGEPIAAAGAVLGAGAGGVAALGFMLFFYAQRRRRETFLITDQLGIAPEPTTTIIKNVLKIAMPIAIGAAVMPMINMMDTVIVLRRLQATGHTYEQAMSLFGQLQGMASTMVNLPQVITIALAMSIVPAMSDAAARDDWASIRQDSASVFRVSMMLGLPASAGLVTLAGPIMRMLFPAEPASLGQVMFIMGFAVLFLTQLQTLTGIIQGLGRPDIPVRNLMIGALFKLVITYTLTATFLHVRGAAIGTVTAYFVAFILNLRAVQKMTGLKLDRTQMIYKPLLCVGVMSAVAYGLHRMLEPVTGNTLAVLTAVTAGAVVYGIMLLKTNSLEAQDFNLLPRGEKIAALLRKLKLMQ